VVLEKERYPRDKYCAGGIGGRADKKLGGLGVRVDVPSVSVSGISAAFQIGDTLLREGDIGRIVRRIEYDEVLMRAARDRGIRIVEGARVTGVRWGAAGVAVESSLGTFEGRVVVGADGVGSIVRRAMGLSFGRLRAQVVEVDTEPVAADRPRDLLHFDMRDRSYAGYVWDFPTLVDGRELVCRGAYVLAWGPAAAPDPQEVLKRRLSELGLDPGRYRMKRFSERGFESGESISRPHTLLVGEAAGIDPILGEGIPQAIDYGALAGHYLAERLGEGDLRFEDWGRRVRRSTLGKDLRLRTEVMRRYYHGWMRESIERYLIEEPSFLRLGMQYFGGKRRSIPDGLKAARSAALLLGRRGLRKVWG
jgi:flavin-dependent dehydrogenase